MGAPLKTPSNLNFKTTMTRDLALSLLRSGNNGEQILQILDTLVLGDSVDECDEYGADPTLDAIDF